MFTDPGIPHSPTRNVDKYRVPTGRRWNKTIPPITPPRARAIADKRRWDRAQELGLTAGFWTESELERALYTGALTADRGVRVQITDDVNRELDALCWRGLLAFATALAVFGARGMIARWDQLADLLGCSNSTARRKVAALVKLELLELVTLTFELHPGGASSYRGGAYKLGGAVGCIELRGTIVAVSCTPLLTPGSGVIHKNEQISGTGEYVCSSPASGSASPRSESSALIAGHPEPASPGVVAASPGIVPDTAALPDESGRAVGPETRQGESCDASRKAPEGEGRDEARAACADLARKIGGAS